MTFILQSCASGPCVYVSAPQLFLLISFVILFIVSLISPAPRFCLMACSWPVHGLSLIVFAPHCYTRLYLVCAISKDSSWYTLQHVFHFGPTLCYRTTDPKMDPANTQVSREEMEGMRSTLGIWQKILLDNTSTFEHRLAGLTVLEGTISWTALGNFRGGRGCFLLLWMLGGASLDSFHGSLHYILADTFI